MEYRDITQIILDAAIEVHRRLGPGLLEKTYQRCLAHELSLRGLSVQTEVSLRIEYKGLVVSDAYRIDILVEDMVVIELKAVDQLINVHKAQVLTYLKTGDYKLGLLINFNQPRLIDGYVRIANGI